MIFTLNRISVLSALFSIISSCSTTENKVAVPPISFDSYKIEPGFEMQLVAKDPLIVAPVAIDFDNQGRIWVVEMRGYMPDLGGNGEEKPVGRISILDDFDENGVAQTSKVFLDSLVLPRALALVYGGLLYAEPPNLWFVEINGDKPGKKTLVDSMYAVGGYVELQPNGLMTNIDNWIYSANSTSRYRMKDGKWVREPTTFRGQWGISKDNYGRMYYNYNEAQLAGDYVLPNAVLSNPYFVPKESENKLLTDNQFVYPLHPTTVNRGYEKGILTGDSLLRRFTAACGPVVYRGDNFPREYYQNVFVCEPQANLIKRNILSFDSVRTSAKQASDSSEFVASKDESFRPVTLTNAPDGSMYVVDMHRGILEHRAVSTPYYRNGIAEKKLDTLLNGGRILRIKNKKQTLDKFPDFVHAADTQLVKMLSSNNGWVRDRSQQLILERRSKTVIPQLIQLLKDGRKPVTAVHALYTLEGLDGLSFDLLVEAAASDNAMMCAHALLLLQKYASKDNSPRVLELLNKLLERKNAVIDLYATISMAAWNTIAPETFTPVLKQLSARHSKDIIYQEAVVNSVAGYENQFRKSGDKVLDSMLSVAIKNKKENKMNPVLVKQEMTLDERANGRVLFLKTCAGCHGADGEGIEHVGPPLRESQYVQGSQDRLAMIILSGLEGPIHINNKEYRFNGTMPNFANNFSDREIADIISYLRNSYVEQRGESINAARIGTLRKKVKGTLTEQKLQEMK
jgi:mono/diheme cytochrome c family protein